MRLNVKKEHSIIKNDTFYSILMNFTETSTKNKQKRGKNHQLRMPLPPWYNLHYSIRSPSM